LVAKGAHARRAAQVLALCIASHHSGLIDCLQPNGKNRFLQRMDKSDDLTRLSEVRANLPGLADEIESILSDDVVEEITRKLSMRPESTKLNR
jgi:CRISPR-associated endonuclease/helicase Cas3